MRCTGAAGDFHARFSAKGKIYRYTIRNAQVLPPLEFGRVWHVPHALDFERLQRAAKLFVGRHDFAAFAANWGSRTRTRCGRFGAWMSCGRVRSSR